MKKFLAFQYNKPSLEIHEIGNEIHELFISSLSEYGYKVIPDNQYDPDWTILLEIEEKVFVLVIGYIRTQLHSWLVSFEDASHNTFDDEEVLVQLTSIINNIIMPYQNISNVVWYENLDFLKPNSK